MKIFLDANILFSAAWSGSRTGKFLAVLLKRAEVVTSAYAVEETRRNLARHEPAALDELWRLMRALRLANETMAMPELNLQAKDRPILEATIAAGCSHLLTGDFKHFGPLLGRMVGGVKVTSMRMLADEFIAKGWVESD
jgi:predicted nucleic acid-binding protein